MTCAPFACTDRRCTARASSASCTDDAWMWMHACGCGVAVVSLWAHAMGVNGGRSPTLCARQNNELNHLKGTTRGTCHGTARTYPQNLSVLFTTVLCTSTPALTDGSILASSSMHRHAVVNPAPTPPASDVPRTAPPPPEQESETKHVLGTRGRPSKRSTQLATRFRIVHSRHTALRGPC